MKQKTHVIQGTTYTISPALFIIRGEEGRIKTFQKWCNIVHNIIESIISNYKKFDCGTLGTANKVMPIFEVLFSEGN